MSDPTTIYEITCYEKSTGRILDTGTTCLPETLETDSVGVIVGQQVSDLDGFRVDLSNRSIVPLPGKPSPHHVFDYVLLQWVDPRTPETQWFVVRTERNALLSASDWTQLPDVPLATKESWAIYRQSLREITEQPDPFNIVWPVPPG